MSYRSYPLGNYSYYNDINNGINNYYDDVNFNPYISTRYNYNHYGYNRCYDKYYKYDRYDRYDRYDKYNKYGRYNRYSYDRNFY